MFRATGSHRGGHGPDQCRHEGSREESHWHGEMLRAVRATVQQVCTRLLYWIVRNNAAQNINKLKDF